MNYPGDLTEEERQQAFEKLREQSVAKWGEHRTVAIETSLKSVSTSIERLDRLRFSRDEAPGFFLHETARNDRSSDQLP